MRKYHLKLGLRMVTANTCAEDVKRNFYAGMNYCIPRRLAPKEMFKTIKSHLR